MKGDSPATWSFAHAHVAQWPCRLYAGVCLRYVSTRPLSQKAGASFTAPPSEVPPQSHVYLEPWTETSGSPSPAPSPLGPPGRLPECCPDPSLTWGRLLLLGALGERLLRGETASAPTPAQTGSHLPAGGPAISWASSHISLCNCLLLPLSLLALSASSPVHPHGPSCQTPDTGVSQIGAERTNE